MFNTKCSDLWNMAEICCRTLESLSLSHHCLRLRDCVYLTMEIGLYKAEKSSRKEGSGDVQRGHAAELVTKVWIGHVIVELLTWR